MTKVFIFMGLMLVLAATNLAFAGNSSYIDYGDSAKETLPLDMPSVADVKKDESIGVVEESTGDMDYNSEEVLSYVGGEH